jgi:RHS repeat-associated protein
VDSGGLHLVNRGISLHTHHQRLAHHSPNRRIGKKVDVETDFDGASFSRTLSRSYYDGDLSLYGQMINSDTSGFTARAYDADGLVVGAGHVDVSNGDALDGYLHITRNASTGRVTQTDFEGTRLVVESTHSYDEFGQPELVTFIDASDSSTIAEFEVLERDDLGRITHSRETFDAQVTDFHYAYEPAGFLRAVWVDTDPATDPPDYEYTYDLNGNREQAYDNAQKQAWVATYDVQDRLLTYAESQGDPDYEFVYDDDLTLEKRVDLSTSCGSEDATMSYGYDAWGSLRSQRYDDASCVSITNDYHTDPLNRRIAKEVDGVFERGFVYDEKDRIIAEFDDGAQTTVSRFVYATKGHVPDLMYSDKEDGTWRWYRLITDWRGSVRLVVRAKGAAVVQRLDYSPFGRTLQDTNPGFQPFGFAGGLYEHDVELVRFGARDYDPLVGRWTNKPPAASESTA